jgi:predicted dehydrogenase
MSVPQVAYVSSRRTKAMRFGVVGIGGYAGVICEQLLAGAREEDAAVEFVCACDPEPARHGETVAALRDGGVRIFRDVEELLGSDIEAVWLPLPIDLHRPYTEMALRAGKAVMVEKPAAGCVQDVDAMISARDSALNGAGLPVAVGFQDIYDPQTLALKRRILRGEIGKVKSAAVMVCWPRNERYYRRTDWAGLRQRNGAWVLDSPANNAMAHFINLVIYLLGDQEEISAEPVEVEAELYRVNPIENYDTCSLRIHVKRADGVAPIVVLMTHACAESAGPVVEIHGERGSMRVSHMRHIELNGEVEVRRAMTLREVHGFMQRSFAAWVRGEECVGIATLEVARAHTVVVNGASDAAKVRTIGHKHVISEPVGGGHVLRSLPGIEKAFAKCAVEGKMLHEMGEFEWTMAAGKKDLRGYRAFGEVKE